MTGMSGISTWMSRMLAPPHPHWLSELQEGTDVTSKTEATQPEEPLMLRKQAWPSLKRRSQRWRPQLHCDGICTGSTRRWNESHIHLHLYACSVRLLTFTHMLVCKFYQNWLATQNKILNLETMGNHFSMFSSSVRFASQVFSNSTEAIYAISNIWNQWRRQDFFRGGGHPVHLKAITRPPQGVRGRRRPRTVAKFHFLIRFKVFENESMYHK